MYAQRHLVKIYDKQLHRFNILDCNNKQIMF